MAPDRDRLLVTMGSSDYVVDYCMYELGVCKLFCPSPLSCSVFSVSAYRARPNGRQQDVKILPSAWSWREAHSRLASHEVSRLPATGPKIKVWGIVRFATFPAKAMVGQVIAPLCSLFLFTTTPDPKLARWHQHCSNMFRLN